MTLQDKLLDCQSKGQAILACNFYNFETLKSIVLAAKSTGQAIILQVTQSSIDYLGLDMTVKMAKTALEQYEVEGWLHLDHSSSIAAIQKALAAGFDSVMIDASDQSFEKNLEMTRTVVDIAAPYNAHVEAELGYIAKLGQRHNNLEFTQAQEAKSFVDQTGVHALAIAIGSAHGFYKKRPNLDLTRLAEIRAATDAFLVLHGSSGIPTDQIVAAIKGGICKINLATEIKNKFMKSLAHELVQTDEIDLRKVFPIATQQTSHLIAEKLRNMSLTKI